MNIRTIEWQKNQIKLIDQTRLPSELKYLYIKDLQKLWQAIKLLKVRGAPALGAAAALGAYLGIRGSKAKDFAHFSQELDKVVEYIASSRPTARNLFWGLERICSVAVKNQHQPVSKIKSMLFKEAQSDISKAGPLKAELDKWNAYREYEDRFLDLFRKAGDNKNYA